MTQAKTPIKKQARGEGAKYAYDQLRREILTLELSPGLPLDETSLSQRFQMSRSPIREALVRLSADGLAVILSNRSTLVAPINVAEFPRYVDALDFLQRINTRLAAKNRSEVDLVEITARAKEFETARLAGDVLGMSATNRDFHLAIADAGKNTFLTKPYGALLDEGRRFLHLSLKHVLTMPEEAFHDRDHQEMILAIRNRDVHNADRLAHEHTKTFHDRFVDSLKAHYLDDFDFDVN